VFLYIGGYKLLFGASSILFQTANFQKWKLAFDILPEIKREKFSNSVNLF